MISVDEAQKIIAEKTSPLDSEQVRLEESLDRVLREAVAADTDQPPFDRSAMDGYAIRADDPSENFKIIAVIQAGDAPAFSLRPGECARIFTGAQIPQNTGAVIRQEDTIAKENSMRITARSKETHIRKRGEDVRAGSELLPPGHLLGPVHLSVMAGVGHTRVKVSRKPRVLHLSSGNEIVAPDRMPEPGQIRDSNSILVKSLVEKAGGEIVGQLHAGDRLDEIIRIARSFAQPYDILLFSGGASVGDFDYAATTLEQLGFTLHFRQVNVRPGKPLIFATNGRQIAFGLPGNPVSHFVTFHLFVRPALRAMLGLTQAEMELVGAHLGCDYDEPPNPRETYAPAQWFYADGIQNHVKPLAWQSSGHLASLISATGLLRIPANSPLIKKGDIVQVFTI
jgi:molybdopterin molybdotransferase